MTREPFSLGELVSLSVAIVLHVALFLTLWLYQDTPEVVPRIERVSVSLAEDVGLEAAAPDPVAESRASTAPTLVTNPMPAPDFEATQPIPAPRPVATTAPRPRATRAPRLRPTPRATRAPRPRATSTAPRRRPDRPESQPTQAPAASTRGGGSRLSDNFLEGAGASTTSSETRMPASQIGRSARASIGQAISRQVRPHFQNRVPTGADAEKLVTILAFELNEDGTLKGRPRVVRQLGVTPANAAQKDRHAEVAINAVRRAAPFDLPAEYYNAWKSIGGARFDRNLSR